MKGKKFQQKNPMSGPNPKNSIVSHKINNKEISPHLNVLQFDSNINNDIKCSNFNKRNKNVRNLSQKSMNQANNINIQNNNYCFNNIDDNFIVKNSNPVNNPNINNKINRNSQKQLKPIKFE